MLLVRCKTWFSEVVSAEVQPQIQLDDLISIWSFGVEHGENDLNMKVSFFEKLMFELVSLCSPV